MFAHFLTQALKSTLISLLLLTATLSRAMTISVYDKNGKLLHSVTDTYATPSTVGQISVDLFNKFQIPYDGSTLGMMEISGIKQELEIISRSEMKAYGWCFAVDGVVPETLTHETQITNPDTHIEWFYAYAHYDSGKWIGQCVRMTKEIYVPIE